MGLLLPLLLILILHCVQVLSVRPAACLSLVQRWTGAGKRTSPFCTSQCSHNLEAEWCPALVCLQYLDAEEGSWQDVGILRSRLVSRLQEHARLGIPVEFTVAENPVQYLEKD